MTRWPDIMTFWTLRAINGAMNTTDIGSGHWSFPYAFHHAVKSVLPFPWHYFVAECNVSAIREHGEELLPRCGKNTGLRTGIGTVYLDIFHTGFKHVCMPIPIRIFQEIIAILFSERAQRLERQAVARKKSHQFQSVVPLEMLPINVKNQIAMNATDITNCLDSCKPFEQHVLVNKGKKLANGNCRRSPRSWLDWRAKSISDNGFPSRGSRGSMPSIDTALNALCDEWLVPRKTVPWIPRRSSLCTGILNIPPSASSSLPASSMETTSEPSGNNIENSLSLTSKNSSTRFSTASTTWMFFLPRPNTALCQ